GVREQLQLVHKHLAAAPAPGGCSCTWRLLLHLAEAAPAAVDEWRPHQQLVQASFLVPTSSFNFNGVQQGSHISSTTRRSAAASAYCSSDTLAEVAAGELETTSSNWLLTHSSAE
ncbi:unnamed protein product, partial [Closterium sp. Naga37s-1]